MDDFEAEVGGGTVAQGGAVTRQVAPAYVQPEEEEEEEEEFDPYAPLDMHDPDGLPLRPFRKVGTDG